MFSTTIAIVVIALFVLALGIRTVRIVPQARVGIIQRLGNYQRTAGSGVAIVVPFIDRMLPLIDLREQVVPLPAAARHHRGQRHHQRHLGHLLPDPRRQERGLPSRQPARGDGATDPDHAAQRHGRPHPRRRADQPRPGQQPTRMVLDEVTEKWGVRVNRLELKDIAPPKDIQIAMEKQMQAERQKRATILTAEGEAQSAVLRARGQQERVDPAERGAEAGGDPQGGGRGAGAGDGAERAGQGHRAGVRGGERARTRRRKRWRTSTCRCCPSWRRTRPTRCWWCRRTTRGWPELATTLLNLGTTGDSPKTNGHRAATTPNRAPAPALPPVVE